MTLSGVNHTDAYLEDGLVKVTPADRRLVVEKRMREDLVFDQAFIKEVFDCETLEEVLERNWSNKSLTFSALTFHANVVYNSVYSFK